MERRGTERCYWQRTVIGVKIIPASKDLGENHAVTMRRGARRRVVAGIGGDGSICIATHQGENTKGVGDAAHDLRSHDTEKRSRESVTYIFDESRQRTSLLRETLRSSCRAGRPKETRKL